MFDVFFHVKGCSFSLLPILIDEYYISIFKLAETDPLLEHGDDDDNDDESTNPFQPDSSSTNGPSGKDIRLTRMNRERKRAKKNRRSIFH